MRGQPSNYRVCQRKALLSHVRCYHAQLLQGLCGKFKMVSVSTPGINEESFPKGLPTETIYIVDLRFQQLK